MSERNKILAIAHDLASRVKADKRPYQTLKWIAEQCYWQYKAEKSEVMEAYFAAVNILKQQGVENAKRKPLTNLSKQQRGSMRKWAKDLAAMMEKVLSRPIIVEKTPIQSDRQ